MKSKYIRALVTQEEKEAFAKYAKDNMTTESQLIRDFVNSKINNTFPNYLKK